MRTNNPNKEVNTTITWKKTGGGSFTLADGRGISSGQTFKAKPEDIPQGARDVVIPLETVPNFPSNLKKKTYELVLAEDESDELYYVQDDNGKKMVDKPLDKETATQLKANLEE